MRRSGNIAKHSPCEEAEVRFVRFCTLSKAELEMWSVAEITESRLYENNIPVRGGPNDLRLGVNSMEFKCQTCGQTRQCQGHFGHIRLHEPVFHYGFMNYLEKVLKCICIKCSKLKTFTTEQQSEKFKKIVIIQNPQKKLRELAKLLGPINQCNLTQVEEGVQSGCGVFLPTKIYVKGYRIVVQDKIQRGKTKEYNLNAQKVEAILAKISDVDAQLLGFTKTKPVDLLIRALAVAPPQVRPSIEMNPQKKAEDDITITYARIVALNNQVSHCREKSERDIKVLDIEKLIASIMVSVDKLNISSLQNTRKKKKTHKIKSIEERLKSKEGRFRQHLMGKRVDFSARSVISPDSNLALDELGVPQKIASSLTIPQEVTQWNLPRIIEMCRNGSVKYLLRPGITERRYQDYIYVSKLGNSPQVIQKYLNYGTVVQRTLQDGDYVLFNRQPTLHRMSMMAHRVKILPYNTFRLNLSVCSPYNADFDGDEMNMHVPQSLQTIAELKHIAHVSKQVIAPKNNAPVMGIVQDSLLGIYLLTMRDTFLTREEMMNLLIWIEPLVKLEFGELPVPAILKPQPLWTGKQIISLLIPSEISVTIFKGKDGFKNKDDTSMVIRRGQLISGALQKQVVGSGAGGLVHAMWLQLGSQKTSEFITNAQRIANNWLMTSTFSVGAEDVIIDHDLQSRRQAQIMNIKKLYFDTLNKYRSIRYVREENLHQRGYRIADSFEVKINMELNNALSNMQKIVAEKVSARKNNIYKMIVAKSKGSQTNLAQIMLCLGNQNVDGRRCPLGFQRRALPHFCKDDNSPQPRGFVFSSFYKGLQPHQFFFHSMGGREGLSDTAVKTSSIGYIQRKLVKSLQDLSIRYDGSVRDSQNNLLQKLYGQDNFLSEYIEKHRCIDAEISEDQFKARMRWQKTKLEQMGYSDKQIKKINEEYDHLKRSRERLRDCYVYGKQSAQIQYYAPIKMDRLFTKINEKATRQGWQTTSAVGPLQIIEGVDRLLAQCITPSTKRQYIQLCARSDKTKHRSAYREYEQQTGIQIFHIHMRMNLSSKQLFNHHFTHQQFNYLMNQVRNKFKQALAPAGEAIGSVAAQSIGQPTTQMTLNTFHLAGVSERNVTLGIPRLRQLLDASKNIKTPMMTIFFKQKILQTDRNNDTVTKLLGQLISFDFPERHIRDYLTKTRIYYDPFPQDSHIQAPYSYDNKGGSKSPWVLSLTFQKKKLTPQILGQINKKLDRIYQNQFEIAEKQGLSGDNPEIVLRCLDTLIQQMRTARNGDDNSIYKYLTGCQAQIKDIFISGIKGLKSVKTAKKMVLRPEYRQQLSKVNKQKHEQIIFQTTGSNLRECLSHYKVDSRRTYCNDIQQIYQVLGIEASRQAFINQFKEILKPYSIYINHRHLTVLADWMSVRGNLTPINRNGINRVRDVSVLRKASFEETADVLFGAAVFSEIDELRGVSERIIFGESIKLGTNSFEVLLDKDTAKYPIHVFNKDRLEIIEEAEGELEDIEKTPNRMQTPTYVDSHYGSNTPKQSSYRSGQTPNFLSPTLDSSSTYMGNSHPNSMSPTYSNPRITSMQSPVYQPMIGYNPSSRLSPSQELPSGLSLFESRQTPPVIRNDYSDDYRSSPNYSPLIDPDDHPKKEEEDSDEESRLL